MCEVDDSTEPEFVGLVVTPFGFVLHHFVPFLYLILNDFLYLYLETVDTLEDFL